MAAKQDRHPNLRHGSDKRLLQAEVVARLRRLLADGVSQSDAAAEVGISVGLLRARLHDQLAGLQRPTRGQRSRHSGGDWHIDAAEIRRRCAAIRETWPAERFLAAPVLDADRLGRIVGVGHDARFRPS